MTDPEVVIDDVDNESESGETERRERRWWGLLAVILLLLLLLLCVVTSTQVLISGGPEQARFIARNVECLGCHTELIPDFSKPTVHNPFALKDCTTCHTKHGRKITVLVTSSPATVWRRTTTSIEWLPLRWLFGWRDSAQQQDTAEAVETQGAVSAASIGTNQIKGNDSDLVMPEQDLCWMCHGDLSPAMNAEFTHQPFKVGRCTNCHNPHAADFSALLHVAPNEICFTCHPMGAQLAKAQVHPSAAEGWCTDCHDPHGSNFKGILVARQRELCFTCHPSVGQLDDMPVQHAPFLNDECTGCHSPHGSDYTPLLVEVQPKLCYECHPEVSNQFAKESHHPIGVDLKCGSCHDPHATQYSGLLSAKDNAFCYECHGTYEANFEASKHDRTLCISCHNPHGSDWSPMLRNSNPDLCLQCHTADHYDESNSVADRNNHPVRPAHYDVNERTGLTCTSSCHNPHGTQYESMFRYFPSSNDGSCLLCHAVTKGKRVGIDF